MDLFSILELIAAVSVGGVAVYLVAIQGVKAAINKEAKGLALDTVFKQFGLNRQGVKFWNELTPQGAATLIATLQSVQRSSGAGAAAGFNSSTMNLLKQIQALTGQIGNVPQAQAQQ